MNFNTEDEFIERLDELSHSDLLDINFLLEYLLDIKIMDKRTKTYWRKRKGSKLPILKLNDVNLYNTNLAADDVTKRVFYSIYHLTRYLNEQLKTKNFAYEQLRDSYSETVIELLHSIVMLRIGFVKQAYQPLRRVIDSIFYGSFSSLTALELKPNPFSFMLNLVLTSENVWNKATSIHIKSIKKFYSKYFFYKDNKQYCEKHHSHSGYKLVMKEEGSARNNPLFCQDEKDKDFVCYKYPKKLLKTIGSTKCTLCKKNAVFVHLTTVPATLSISKFIDSKLSDMNGSFNSFLKKGLEDKKALLRNFGVDLNQKQILKQLWNGLSLYVHANPNTHQHSIKFNDEEVANLSDLILIICNITTIMFLASAFANPKIRKYVKNFIVNIKQKNNKFIDEYNPNKEIINLISNSFVI